MMGSRTFKSVLAGSVCALALSTVAMAQETAKTFDVPAGDLAPALDAYIKQSGEQLIYRVADVRGMKTPGVRGALSSDEALQQLLAGTALKVQRDPSGLIAIASIADPQSSGAAGDGAEGTVQALIVTAQKREENIQDVPIAMSAFTQEDLTRSQVAGGPDLMTQVPNMTFTKTNFSSYSIQIRGIGTQAISATVDPAVAVAFNNTPFVRNRFFEQEFYDLERVEVLRGPQGTLYGRNATAGVVNILSAKPKFTYQAKISADIGNYNSRRVEGMINLPLVDDKVALRLAGAWTKRDGYTTNQLTGNPIDGRDLWSTRVSLRFAPTDKINANLIWEHFQEDDDRLRSGKQLCHKDVVTEVGGITIPDAYNGKFSGSQATHYQSQLSQGCKPASLYSPDSFETPNGWQLGYYWPLGSIGLPVNTAVPAEDPYVSRDQSRDLRVIESTVDPSYKAKSDTVELQATFNLSDTLSLTSETAWASDFLFSTEDYNRFNTRSGAWENTGDRPGLLTNGVFCDPQIGCADRLVALDLSTAKSRHFSQELRLASDFDGPFNFSLGGNFLRYDTEDKYYVFINALTLWGSTSFQTGITAPYVPNQSSNAECRQYGLQPVDLNASGGVPVTGGLGCLYIDPNPIGSLNDLGHNYFLSKNPYKLISYAAFGEAYYNITDNLKLTAGLRWTVDKKEAPRIPSWLLAENVGYPVLEVVDQEWREPTGRLTLDWKPDLAFTDETLLYVSLAHGYKAGGANPPPAGIALNVDVGNGRPSPSDTHPLTFDPEFVNALEVGSKNTLLDGRLTLNTTAFYYDYKGYQLSQIVDRSAITKNFDATIWGLEIETDWRPLENLKLGFKGGYENTRVADGMSAVDVMDRANGGLPDANGVRWIVVKPFPTYPSNCIVPDYLSAYNGRVNQIGNVAGSDNGPCNMAYFEGLDPITSQPYVANPPGPGYFNGGFGANYPNYPGFDPASAPNNGEGFSKDLSGHELPNAPHFTATITADYTLPLPSNWLMTLHTDLYYQSEAWTRIFNMPGYDKLKAYSNVNFAAIFSNEDAGWKAMAYVKNVFDRDSITGAFLNSDDSGLTTNVFLTEPRLYGLRVTKEFTGGPWWTGAGSGHVGPYPLTIEIGGQVQRQDAPYEPLQPSFSDSVPAGINVFAAGQNTDLDWGDGRDLKVNWRPDSGRWTVSAGVRYGRTNGTGPRLRKEEATPEVCVFAGSYAAYCPLYAEIFGREFIYSVRKNWSEIETVNHEEHEMADFAVGRDVSIGGLNQSTLSLGLQQAEFKSTTAARMDTIPDWIIPEGMFYPGGVATHSREMADLREDRTFRGAGPILAWDATQRLFGNSEYGVVGLDWSIKGGALFGKQKTAVSGSETTANYEIVNNGILKYGNHFAPTAPPVTTSVAFARSKSVAVPVGSIDLGLSYEIQRVKIGAGYRWERYFDVLDVGYAEHQSGDRTMDGPYFKIAVGFGG